MGDLKVLGTGGFLAASLPRTLPGSTFPFAELNLVDVHFQKVNDLVRVIRDLSELQVLHCQKISFEDATIVNGVVPRRREVSGPAYRSLEVGAKDCGGHEMEKELMFCLVSRTVQRRYTFKPLGEIIWQAFKDVFLALKMQGQGIMTLECEYFCGVLPLLSYMKPLRRLCQARGPSIIFRDRGLYDLRIKQGRRAAISVSLSLENKDIELDVCDWDAIETAVIGLSSAQVLNLAAMHKTSFKTLLEAILGGKILTRLHRLGRLDLEWYPPNGGMSVSIHDLVAIPVDHNADGRSVTLTPSERVDLMLCKNEEEKVSTLRTIFESRDRRMTAC